MKAITLIQPWASLIALGEKRIETRSWNTGYRGPIAIHAGKKPPVDLGTASLYAALERADVGLDDLPLGSVVATATLIDCIWFDDGFYERLCEGLIEHAARYERDFGDFSGGRFGWYLDNVVPLPEPIPARGYQGLWDWDEVAHG